MKIFRARILVLGAAGVITVLLPAGVMAQGAGSLGGGGGGASAVSPKALVAPKSEVQPAALPGARPSPGGRDRTAPKSGLPPNEALFDAVNRGDIGSAREALGRGADIEAHNLLGLTPVELSVDLGRNDITFLLLSMRAGGGSRGAPAVPARPTAAPVSRVAVAPAPTRPVAAPTRQQLSTDPGIPAPQAGFLGFGRTP